MLLKFELTKIQHVSSMSFSIDLTENKLTCIVGKNGAGKTTLIKAIKNLSLADTFAKTSSSRIFSEQSSILYTVDNKQFNFYYDKAIKGLNCRELIPESVKSNIAVELPMPHGERFNFFQSVSDADLAIRSSIVLEKYHHPHELIEFMTDIYSGLKFNNLVEIKVKSAKYYCILLDDNRYVREDYLSSGEYFIISLYRKIKSNCKLIVIDEIDISLDAAAQAHLVKNLRKFCKKYEVNIVFTTHSLAMMRTLNVDELFYMQEVQDRVELLPSSYNYIKSILFGFSGWDKYILTEDSLLQGLLEYIIQRYCLNIFYKYKIIYVGGATNVADLMKRNSREKFLSEPVNVIAVFDGDQKKFRWGKRPATHCIPIENVEQAIFDDYKLPGLLPRLKDETDTDTPKKLFKKINEERLMSELQIFAYICDKNERAINDFAKVMNDFLSRPTA